MTASLPTRIRQRGLRLIQLMEYAGLLIVLAATVIATAQEVMLMVANHRVEVADLLLLFIYLEVITMSGVYWRVGRLPVRMPLYIAMVAIARHMMLDTQAASDPGAIMGQAAAILLLGVAVLVVRFGHIRLPYIDENDEPPKNPVPSQEP